MMKNKQWYFGALALTVVSLGAYAENLIDNGGFESGQSGWFLFVPDASAGSNCSLRIDKGSGRGESAAAVVSSDLSARYALASTKHPAVRAGERYRITAWVKADRNVKLEVGTPGIMIRLLFKNDDGKELKKGGLTFISMAGAVENNNPANIVTESIPYDWTLIEAVVEVPAGAATMDIQLTSSKTQGALFWDDVEVGKIEDDTPFAVLSCVKKKVKGCGTALHFSGML
jgi:hypothetical protein